MLVAAPEVYYPESGSVDFIAYYPYTASVASGYTIAVDVSNQATALPGEALYSNSATNQAATEDAVMLNFTYSLAKLEITAVGDENSTLAAADFTAMTASIEGLYTQAKLQLADGTFTGKDVLYKTGSTATSATFEALVLPTAVTDGELTFAFLVGGVTCQKKMTATYAAANLYRLNFAIDGSSPSQSTAILLNSCIEPRTDNPTQNYTASVSQSQPFEFEMVFVEGGTFMMGNPSGGEERERPVHQVTLSSFNIGKYEVTQGQWEAVMGTTIEQQVDKVYPTYLPPNPLLGKGDNYPMYWITWNEVRDFITRLNELTGKNYRLPTEAEWEYAARGGNQSKGYTYSGSNTLGDVAWYVDNSGDSKHPVGEKSPNELGIYDMCGNVTEACSDWYGDYPSTAQINPQGPLTGSSRIQRGGHCSNDISYGFCRVAYRGLNLSTNRGPNDGFRLVLPVD
jgi:formylglycine-generating enzyme required for sulfatase activity